MTEDIGEDLPLRRDGTREQAPTACWQCGAPGPWLWGWSSERACRTFDCKRCGAVSYRRY